LENEKVKDFETENKLEKDTLFVNGLKINLKEQLESSCKNIIHPNTTENIADIHLKGIIEMFRLASEHTKRAPPYSRK